MVVAETFPAGPQADETTATFLKLIASIVETDAGATALAVDPHLGGNKAVASALAAASGTVQSFLYIPAAREYRVVPVRVRDPESPLFVVLPWWNVYATKSAYAFCAELWNRISLGERSFEVAQLRADITARLSSLVSRSVNEFALVKGITELGINLIRLPGGVLCLGTGSLSRWMSSTTSDATSAIGLKLAGNKYITARVLRSFGLPGAENQIVADADAAVATAAQLGYPVVVKPADLERGEGVAADLRNDAEVRAAYDHARAVSEKVLVEKLISGFTHRFTVVGAEVISVRQRVPGGVTGDGKSTIEELVFEVQKSDRSWRWQQKRGKLAIELDREALELMARDGFDHDTVLPEGKFVRLRRRDNINAGGENRDIDLAMVHRDNIELAIAAARALRLDIAGIDLISTDITRSWRDVDAGICEVNGRPQFASYRTPEIFRQVITRVTGPDPHVPARLIICADDPAIRTAVVRSLNDSAPGYVVSIREGLWRDGVVLTQPFADGYAAAVAAATRPDTEAMICIMSLRELLSSGTPLRKWSDIRIRETGLSDDERALVPAVRSLLATTPTNAVPAA